MSQVEPESLIYKKVKFDSKESIMLKLDLPVTNTSRVRSHFSESSSSSFNPIYQVP